MGLQEVTRGYRGLQRVTGVKGEYKGFGGACTQIPRKKKFLKIGLWETPYPAFPGSNAINSYVYFVELYSEPRYS